MVEQLCLMSCLPDDWVQSLEGRFIDECHFDRLIDDEDTDVFKPDGSLLLSFRRNILSAGVCNAAYSRLLNVPKDASNRGTAAGGRAPRRKRDGTMTRGTYAKNGKSAVIGFMDRSTRHPYCRATSFTWQQVEKWREVLPFVREVNSVFSRELPERYAVQRAIAQQTSPDFVIRDTAFTTITVNRNWQTAVHKDAGDLKEGFGVMSVLRAGAYAGGYLVFPKYGVGVDMRTQDVLLADVHEFHGNTPIVGKRGGHERISTVFYYRTKMRRCGTAEQEFEAIQNRM